MERKRIKLSVYLDLDPTPGVMNTAGSAHSVVFNLLQTRMGHYNPVVEFEDEVSSTYKDTAMLVTETSLRPGGVFFMNNEATLGYYYICSEDPIKRDLVLPPHLFRKCFIPLEPEAFNRFTRVMEKL